VARRAAQGRRRRLRGDAAAVAAPHARPRRRSRRRRRSKKEEPEEELLTELGNARRIVRIHGEDLRFTGAVGWYAWDGKRWMADDTAEATRRAKHAVVSLLDDAKALGSTEKADQTAAWAIKSQKRSIIEASLALASTEPKVILRRTDFDRNPWLLNVENGTIDLRTGVLSPHDKKNLITRFCPVTYDPKAYSPRWAEFLERVLPDVAVREFFQRYLGSCLTGDASDQALVILYGPGANGKSTAIETVTRIMGDYFVGTPFSTLTMSRDRGQATNDLASLAGARYVVAAEPPEGASLNSSTVKILTGGDTITARHLYREFFSFQPEFKLSLVTNHRPKIEESTHAIWRRVHSHPVFRHDP
jgi:putative DNA primase/helicase